MQKEIKLVRANISKALTENELTAIKIFLKRAKELSQTYIMSHESKISSNIIIEKGKQIKFSASLPDEEYLRSFYMAFRCLYLQKEKSNFIRIANIVKTRTDNESSKKYIDHLKDIWSGALERQERRVYIAGEEITPNMLIDLWFNAHYFHSDELKEQNLTKLKKILSCDVCRFMLASSVYDASKAVLDLANSLHAFDE